MEDTLKNLSRFNRDFFNKEKRLTYIGTGSLGGKGLGLARINNELIEHLKAEQFPYIEVSVPSLCMLRTGIFDAFMKQNKLYDIAFSGLPDDRIAHAFQKAELPFEILGDLRALISQVTTPLAVRSSSMLEDALHEPFAGIYGTKMTPNNQHDISIRFNKLVEAIKFVYASTFFKEAKDYIKATKHKSEDEKMAVIIQEIVGAKHGDRFYPQLSGVGRSHNYYAFGNAKAEDGIVNLALGLGKTIVDGGTSWAYSPAFPRSEPPFGSVNDMLKNTQTDFWSVNMGPAPAYDPVKETEYLVKNDLLVAEGDKVLRHVASTVDMQSGRVILGVGKPGPRLLNFAPLLRFDEIKLNDLIKELLSISEKSLNAPVEIEFAMNFSDTGEPHRFGFLQVRPMVVSTDLVEVSEEELTGEQVLASSNMVLGNKFENTVTDIVYVKKDSFNSTTTLKISEHLEKINSKLIAEGKQYLLMGFGRWGTSDQAAGVPVNWGQISGARVIVEAAIENMNFEMSQGSHFFHNVTGFSVLYFSVPFKGKYAIDWDWLDKKESIEETEFVRHIRLEKPLEIKVDGRTGLGVIIKS